MTEDDPTEETETEVETGTEAASHDDAASDWTDMVVGERMQLDQEFEQKVAASNFSRQQWGLIMTAVEFDVENPDDPETARLVAVTSKLDAVLPELERMDEGRGGPPGTGAGGAGSGASGGSFLDNIKESLGLGGDDADREQRAAAAELAQMYADDLQEKLESRGKWERVCLAAQE